MRAYFSRNADGQRIWRFIRGVIGEESGLGSQNRERFGWVSCTTNEIAEGIPALTEHRENSRDSIRFNLEFDSNEIDESDSHHAKQDESRLSGSEGISMSHDFGKRQLN
jgi:hypothetical protein